MQEIQIKYIRVEGKPVPEGVIVIPETVWDRHYNAALGYVAGARTVSRELLARVLEVDPIIADGVFDRLHTNGVIGGPDPGVYSHNMPDWRTVLTPPDPTLQQVAP